MHFYDNCFYCCPDNPYFILRMCDIIESTFHLLLLSTFSLCFSMNLAETKIGPKITKQKNFSARHKVVTVVRSRQDMAAWTLFAPTSSLFGQKTAKVENGGLCSICFMFSPCKVMIMIQVMKNDTN